MLAGELYRPDAELAADHTAAEHWMARYNASGASSAAELHALLSARFRKVGKDAVIRPPFFCDYGGNISLGDGVFLNFNCVILDVVEVTIGDKFHIGSCTKSMTALVAAMLVAEGRLKWDTTIADVFGTTNVAVRCGFPVCRGRPPWRFARAIRSSMSSTW